MSDDSVRSDNGGSADADVRSDNGGSTDADVRSDNGVRADDGGRAPAVTGSAGDVLVLRALGLGDAVAGVAALRGVRRAFPGRRLVLATPNGVGSWLRDQGVVDEVLPTAGLDAPLAWERPGGHVAVNLHGRGPASHRLLAATGPSRLVAFGCEEAGHDGPAWQRDEHEVDRWCRLVRSVGGECSAEDLRLRPPSGGRGQTVVLHPGAASVARRWPAERWTAVARALARTGRAVVVTGSGDELGACAAMARAAGPGVRSVAGTLSLPALAELVARAGLLVCGDTGVAHLATAFATPSVLLFGPTPPRWWGPAIDHGLHTVLWHGTAPGDPHAATLDPALAAITPGEVVEAADDLLSRTSVPAGLG